MCLVRVLEPGLCSCIGCVTWDRPLSLRASACHLYKGVLAVLAHHTDFGTHHVLACSPI